MNWSSYEQVVAAMELLAERGPLWAARWSALWSVHDIGTRRSCGPGATGRSELRVLFAFDPERRAIMLVAGDKSGSWKKWYSVNIPIADDRFSEHLDRLKGKGL